VLSFATTVLVFRNLREFEPIDGILPLMGFGPMAVYAVDELDLLELFPTRPRSTGTSSHYNGGRIALASAPFTIRRHPPLPE
jgi:hypothetical protein